MYRGRIRVRSRRGSSPVLPAISPPTATPSRCRKSRPQVRWQAECPIRASPVQPLAIAGVCELPVASFRDAFGRIRPLHLPGCTVEEVSDALFHAWRNRWPVFVVVLHSFSELCRLLNEQRDKFETVVFSTIAP